uniref:Uncharacterized protein n=1 Tax=Sphenodon punctatus TaxID=8508 RepID=A0A8D0GUV0_SPHPU
MYKPLLPYLKILQEKVPSFELQHEHRHREQNKERCLQGGRLLYNLCYLGQANVGKYGGKEMLDHGISMVLEQHLSQQVSCLGRLCRTLFLSVGHFENWHKVSDVGWSCGEWTLRDV